MKRILCWFGWHSWAVWDAVGREGGICLPIALRCMRCRRFREFSLCSIVDSGTWVETYRGIRRRR